MSLNPFVTPIATKNVRETPSRSDGRRVLVMSLWPRGVKKTAVDAWYKELGTPLPLIRRWKSGRLSWTELSRGYARHLKTPVAAAALKKLVALARRQRVTLLCLCRDASRCHRTLLRKEVERLARRRA